MMQDSSVVMTCMTTKNKFEVQSPEVVLLRNGRYAFRASCPWKGKNDKDLVAYKFAGKADYAKYAQSQSEAPEEQSEAPEEPEEQLAQPVE